MTQTVKLLDKTITKNPDGKKYNKMVVVYNDGGEMKTRHLLDFVNKPLYNFLNDTPAGSMIDIFEEKNDKGYFELKSASLSNSQAPVASDTRGIILQSNLQPSKTTNSTYSTKEERDQTQQYIIRQSCLKTAVDLFGIETAKSKASGGNPVLSVIDFAKQFEDYVLGVTSQKTTSASVAKKVNAQIDDDLNDDIPV